MSDKWMTVGNVAEYLQLSTDQIYRLAQQGRIPVSKIGSRWRFKREKIDEWMDRQDVNRVQSATRAQSKAVRRCSSSIVQEPSVAHTGVSSSQDTIGRHRQQP